MLGKLLDAFFGCSHDRFSFPLTVRKGSRRSAAASVTGTYVVCLDCGKELGYDWKEMKVLRSSRDNRRALGTLATKEAA
jgi:hypothetical protein